MRTKRVSLSNLRFVDQLFHFADQLFDFLLSGGLSRQNHCSII